MESQGIFPLAEKLPRRAAAHRIILQAYPEADVIEIKDNKDRSCVTSVLAHALQQRAAE